MLLAVLACTPVGAQIKTPPIAQLAQDIEDRSASVSTLPGRINAAFDATLFESWFAVPKDGSDSTGPDDTIHLVRALRQHVDNATTIELPFYRRAWRTLCRRIFALRVPAPKELTAHVAQHLDYPTSTQEFAMVQIVTYLFEANVDVWLPLDLGPAAALDRMMAFTKDAQDQRVFAETANDRHKLGDVEVAYVKILSMCEDLSVQLNLGKA